jgi:hypothetical protein
LDAVLAHGRSHIRRYDPAVDRKIENIRRAVEEGFNDASWANTRLRALHAEKESLVAVSGKTSGPPQLDAATAMEYRRQADKLFRGGGQAERKQLLRILVEEVKLMPQDSEVSISYRLPEAIMNGLVAGVDPSCQAIRGRSQEAVHGNQLDVSTPR